MHTHTCINMHACQILALKSHSKAKPKHPPLLLIRIHTHTRTCHIPVLESLLKVKPRPTPLLTHMHTYIHTHMHKRTYLPYPCPGVPLEGKAQAHTFASRT